MEYGTEFSEYERNPAKKWVGITLVILLHLIIIYALVTGLAHKVVEVINQPVETRIIEEIKPPPPPPERPKVPPPKVLTPPPFVPPPEVEVQPAPQQQNTITAVTNVKPDNPIIVPVQPAPPLRVPVRVPATVDSKACEKPEYPRSSLRREEQGTVTLEFLIGIDGRVIDSRVEISSGFKELDKAAMAGLSLCKFKPGTVDGKPEQSWTKMRYVWRLE